MPAGKDAHETDLWAENAEIGLTYKKANFVRKEDGSFKNLGTIEAYASVSFE